MFLFGSTLPINKHAVPSLGRVIDGETVSEGGEGTLVYDVFVHPIEERLCIRLFLFLQLAVMAQIDVCC